MATSENEQLAAVLQELLSLSVVYGYRPADYNSSWAWGMLQAFAEQHVSSTIMDYYYRSTEQERSLFMRAYDTWRHGNV